MWRAPVPALALALAAAPAAEAELKLCNTTAAPVEAALGLPDGNGVWGSRGWIAIAPGACALMIERPLMSRYYYVHARHEGAGGGWVGDRAFCVGEGPFAIEGRGECEQRGFRRAGFLEIDTGESRAWTEYLSD